MLGKQVGFEITEEDVNQVLQTYDLPQTGAALLKSFTSEEFEKIMGNRGTILRNKDTVIAAHKGIKQVLIDRGVIKESLETHLIDLRSKFGGFTFTVEDDPDYAEFFSVYAGKEKWSCEIAGKIGEKSVAAYIASVLGQVCK